jgi:hypothetical protein
MGNYDIALIDKEYTKNRAYQLHKLIFPSLNPCIPQPEAIKEDFKEGSKLDLYNILKRTKSSEQNQIESLPVEETMTFLDWQQAKNLMSENPGNRRVNALLRSKGLCIIGGETGDGLCLFRSVMESYMCVTRGQRSFQSPTHFRKSIGEYLKQPLITLKRGSEWESFPHQNLPQKMITALNQDVGVENSDLPLAEKIRIIINRLESSYTDPENWPGSFCIYMIASYLRMDISVHHVEENSVISETFSASYGSEETKSKVNIISTGAHFQSAGRDTMKILVPVAYNDIFLRDLLNNLSGWFDIRQVAVEFNDRTKYSPNMLAWEFYDLFRST